MAHNKFKEGYVQIYTGNGKGKTTAAIGVTVRAMASGMNIFFGQFMKNTESAEHIFFREYPESITFMQFGTGKFVRGKPEAEDYEKAAIGWNHCLEAINSQRYDLVVLDELNVALSMNLIPIESVLAALSQKPKQLEIIITGRYAPAQLVEAADLVTEMIEVKHYYKKGVPSRKGIEE